MKFEVRFGTGICI